jgi:ankyrin repeat protein
MEYKSIRIQEEINIKLNRLKFIIELGANINIKNYDGYSPFIKSYKHNNITVLNYLLK